MSLNCLKPKKEELGENAGINVPHSIIDCSFCLPAVDIIRASIYFDEIQTEALKCRLQEEGFRAEVLKAMENMSAGDQDEIWHLLEKIMGGNTIVHDTFFKGKTKK